MHTSNLHETLFSKADFSLTCLFNSPSSLAILSLKCFPSIYSFPLSTCLLQYKMFLLTYFICIVYFYTAGALFTGMALLPEPSENTPSRGPLEALNRLKICSGRLPLDARAKQNYCGHHIFYNKYVVVQMAIKIGRLSIILQTVQVGQFAGRSNTWLFLYPFCQQGSKESLSLSNI